MYIKRDDVIKALDVWGYEEYTATLILADIPNVDAVEVVRCKDCRHRHTDDCSMYHETWYEIDEGCGYFDNDYAVTDYTDDNGFCSVGERSDI